MPKGSVRGFTLIELLVTISIIAILLALSVFGILGARQASRDAKRKADLEIIRGGLELYKSDCGSYPATLPAAGSSLTGGACNSNTYIQEVPSDPSGQLYPYSPAGTPPTTYVLCASLEQSTGSVAGCGSCGSTSCNYKIVNP